MRSGVGGVEEAGWQGQSEGIHDVGWMRRRDVEARGRDGAQCFIASG